MTETNKPDVDVMDRQLVITRVFDAPRDLVWKAWTEPDRLALWWGPKGFKLIVAGLDLRPGGVFHYGMRTANGQEMWGKFVYVEVVAPERIVLISSFSDAAGNITRHPMSAAWPLEVMNTLTLTEHDGKTTLILRGGPHNATAEERKTFEDAKTNVQMGFKGTFDQLDEYLASAR